MDTRVSFRSVRAKAVQRPSIAACNHREMVYKPTTTPYVYLSGSSQMSAAAFYLRPKAPFNLELTAWALRRRANNPIDRWDGHTYKRVLVFGDKPREMTVTQSGPSDVPRLHVTLTGKQLTLAEKASARKTLERLLGLHLDLGEFYQLASRDSNLGPLVERFRGVKPPRFPSLFEALANAIACQQMSLSLGILLLSRLTQRFGLPMHSTREPAQAFPRPEALAGLKPEALRELGFSRQKGRALITLAQAFCESPRDWDTLEELDNQAALERLLELRGIGRWSAEYVLLRGLGRLDVFPGDDVGAHNALKRWLGLPKKLGYEEVRRITAKW